MPTGTTDAASAAAATVITDAPDYASTLLEFVSDRTDARPEVATTTTDGTPALLADAFFGAPARAVSWTTSLPGWPCLVVSGFSPHSQYDRLIGLARQRFPLPDRLACVARSGNGFKGFRNRSWVACPGNIHLTLHLAPDRAIERFETVFLALAAISVAETVESVPGLAGRTAIRWVNDVVVDEAKVAGVLAYSQTKGATVTSVILGIGLNVEKLPVVPPTAFVPRVGALRSFAADPGQVRAGAVLRHLLEAIDRNYRTLLREGYRPIIDRYRARSIVIGREVSISSDEPDEVPRIFASGVVRTISDDLALHLEGSPLPVTRGRLILPTAEIQRDPPLSAPRPGVAS